MTSFTSFLEASDTINSRLKYTGIGNLFFEETYFINLNTEIIVLQQRIIFCSEPLHYAP